MELEGPPVWRWRATAVIHSSHPFMYITNSLNHLSLPPPPHSHNSLCPFVCWSVEAYSSSISPVFFWFPVFIFSFFLQSWVMGYISIHATFFSLSVSLFTGLSLSASFLLFLSPYPSVSLFFLFHHRAHPQAIVSMVRGSTCAVAAAAASSLFLCACSVWASLRD